jgi:hypothetical protein
MSRVAKIVFVLVALAVILFALGQLGGEKPVKRIETPVDVDGKA